MSLTVDIASYYVSAVICIIVYFSLYFTVTDRPEVRYLNRYVRDSVCAEGNTKWHDLGLILIGESGRNDLGIIKLDKKHSVFECCDAMFALWLQRDTQASWGRLITALREIFMEVLADELTKRLS